MSRAQRKTKKFLKTAEVPRECDGVWANLSGSMILLNEDIL
jgi:hypothetical protein